MSSTKQKIQGNVLVTTTEREICERRAEIRDNGDGTFTFRVFGNGECRPYIESSWPPPGWPPQLNRADYVVERLRNYIATVQFGGRDNLGWRKEGKVWLSDTMLGDSGGNGFNEAELDLIRHARKGQSL